MLQRLLIVLIIITSCTSVQKSSKANYETCPDHVLEKYAENIRRNYLDSAKHEYFESQPIPEAFDSLIKIVGFERFAPIDQQEALEEMEQLNRKYKYQSPIPTVLLQIAMSNIEKYAELDSIRRPIISFKPSSIPTAEIYMSPYKNCNRRIIFINEGVQEVSYFVPRRVINLISLEELASRNFSYRNQDRYFVQNPEVIEKDFNALWTEGYREGNFLQIMFAMTYQVAVTHFLVAHEYAHDIFKHEGSSHLLEVDSLSPINRIQYSWAQELEADYFAANILTKLRTEDKSIQFDHIMHWGSEYYFIFLDFYNLERSHNLYEIFQKSLPVTNNIKENVYDDIDKIKYIDTDSLVNRIIELLPEKPKTKDFYKLIDNLKMSDKTELSSTHPPSYLRRAICRASIQSNSNLNSLVTGQMNHGDLYWKNFSRLYDVMKVILRIASEKNTNEN